MIPLPLVIMAGGKSSRMGRDKALLPFGGFDTLTQYQLSRFHNHFLGLYVSCKTKEKFDFSASFIEDNPLHVTRSPLVALSTVLEQLQCPVCVLSVDTPFVTPTIFEALHVALREGVDASIARSPQGAHPMVGIYTPTLVPLMTQMLARDEHKLGALLVQSRSVYTDFEADDPFFNLNHPHEYTHAQHYLKEHYQ